MAYDTDLPLYSDGTGGLAGNGSFGDFSPFQLWAGESKIVTTDETIAQFGVYEAYTVMGRRADGKLVALAPSSGDSGGSLVAKGTATFNAVPAANDTLTVAGLALTFIANGGVPVGNQVAVGTTAAATAQEVAAFFESESETTGVTPFLNGAVVTFEANVPGTAGNAITLAKSSAGIAVSGATLAGGTATGTEAAPESVPCAVLGTAIDTTAGDVQGPVYLEGVFNYQALVWPDGITTLVQMKQLCDKCNFSVKALK